MQKAGSNIDHQKVSRFPGSPSANTTQFHRWICVT